ncbi:hypothetical protein B0H19DRAFT_1076587 [Mycena capillaripes]|nr:hypothetical protein B0H19DRAFT_1076587 [Mycena capillaripes]
MLFPLWNEFWKIVEEPSRRVVVFPNNGSFWGFFGTDRLLANFEGLLPKESFLECPGEILEKIQDLLPKGIYLKCLSLLNDAELCWSRTATRRTRRPNYLWVSSLARAAVRKGAGAAMQCDPRPLTVKVLPSRPRQISCQIAVPPTFLSAPHSAARTPSGFKSRNTVQPSSATRMLRRDKLEMGGITAWRVEAGLCTDAAAGCTHTAPLCVRPASRHPRRVCRRHPHRCCNPAPRGRSAPYNRAEEHSLLMTPQARRIAAACFFSGGSAGRRVEDSPGKMATPARWWRYRNGSGAPPQRGREVCTAPFIGVASPLLWTYSDRCGSPFRLRCALAQRRAVENSGVERVLIVGSCMPLWGSRRRRPQAHRVGWAPCCLIPEWDSSNAMDPSGGFDARPVFPPPAARPAFLSCNTILRVTQAPIDVHSIRSGLVLRSEVLDPDSARCGGLDSTPIAHDVGRLSGRTHLWPYHPSWLEDGPSSFTCTNLLPSFACVVYPQRPMLPGPPSARRAPAIVSGVLPPLEVGATFSSMLLPFLGWPGIIRSPFVGHTDADADDRSAEMEKKFNSLGRELNFFSISALRSSASASVCPTKGLRMMPGHPRKGKSMDEKVAPTSRGGKTPDTMAGARRAEGGPDRRPTSCAIGVLSSPPHLAESGSKTSLRRTRPDLIEWTSMGACVTRSIVLHDRKAGRAAGGGKTGRASKPPDAARRKNAMDRRLSLEASRSIALELSHSGIRQQGAHPTRIRPQQRRGDADKWGRADLASALGGCTAAVPISPPAWHQAQSQGQAHGQAWPSSPASPLRAGPAQGRGTLSAGRTYIDAGADGRRGADGEMQVERRGARHTRRKIIDMQAESTYLLGCTVLRLLNPDGVRAAECGALRKVGGTAIWHEIWRGREGRTLTVSGRGSVGSVSTSTSVERKRDGMWE